jgi:hypothetical protein
MKTGNTFMVTLLLALLLFSSCGSNEVRNQALPSVIGRAGELLVVIDKGKWDSALGDTLRYVLAAQIPNVTQEESYFDLIQTQDDKFKGVYKNHRNLLIVNIKPSAKPSLSFKEDAWASPQLVGYLVAPSVDSMINLVLREGEAMRNKFAFKEVERWAKINQKTPNRKVTDALKSKHNYWVSVPSAYSLDVNKDHFVWIASETADVTLAVIGWDYPYTSKDQLTDENLIKKRNEVVKENVPGPVAKSYMRTEDVLAPISSEFVYKGRYFKQISGLWKLENAFMGGSFVSLTTVDDERKRIITVEGFVYAPRKEKRNYLRQLEGILYTLEVSKEKK